jgi:hypothetical protein
MYSNLKESGSFASVQIPDTFLPNPSDRDYSDGVITRYFIQKANDKISPIFELNELNYSKLLNNPFWAKVELKWRIKGDLEPVFNQKGMLIDPGVRNFNLNQIAKFQKTIPTLGGYLINPTQFYKPYRI